jgi:hypothetical protein
MTRITKSLLLAAVATLALTATPAHAQQAVAIKRASEVLAYTGKCVPAANSLSDKDAMTLAIAILGSGAVFNEAGQMASVAAAKDAQTRAAIDPTFCTATWEMIQTLAHLVRMQMPNVEEFVRRSVR